MTKLNLIAIGNSTGSIWPKDVLEQLNVAKGDALYLTKAPDGYRLTPYDPEFADQMTVARKIMKKRRNVLRELAK